MIGLSFGTGYYLNELIGYKTVTESTGRSSYTYKSDKHKVGWIGSAILSIPISAAINNMIWSEVAFQRAAFQSNTRLIQENPEIDVFLNPKHEIDRYNGLWKQKTNMKLRTLGATLKTDD